MITCTYSLRAVIQSVIHFQLQSSNQHLLSHFTKGRADLLTGEMDMKIKWLSRDQNQRVGAFNSNCDLFLHTHTAVKTSQGTEPLLQKTSQRENYQLLLFCLLCGSICTFYYLCCGDLNLFMQSYCGDPLSFRDKKQVPKKVSCLILG